MLPTAAAAAHGPPLRRVLVVEADQAALDAAVRSLGPLTKDLVTASAMAEALGALEAGPPNVVVIDDRLPDGSGLELAREVRRRSPASVCVLMLEPGDASALHEARGGRRGEPLREAGGARRSPPGGARGASTGQRLEVELTPGATHHVLGPR